MNLKSLSIAYPASVQAVPTTYQYTGNPFTFVDGAYTTSDFVSVMVTLAGPLGANMPLTEVTPIAFTLFDGVQTLSNTTPNLSARDFRFATNANGEIISWAVEVDGGSSSIFTFNDRGDGGLTCVSGMFAPNGPANVTIAVTKSLVV